MFFKRYALGVVILLVCWATVVTGLEDNALFVENNIMPEGRYYQRTVPDTLDLAERGRLLVHGLTSFLNEATNYGPYGHGFFNVNPPYLTTVFGSGVANWGKITEAMLMGRVISGSDLNLDIETKSFSGMVDYIGDGGGSVPTARVMMALMSLYQQSPSPELMAEITKLNQSFHDKATIEGDEAYFYNGEPLNDDHKIGVIGYGWHSFIQGSNLRAMSRFYELTGDQATLELAEKVKNFTMRAEFWQPEAEPKAEVGSDHGHFMGHHHSYTSGLMGLLKYAEVTNDVRVMFFVREGYEYLRGVGIARIGLFGEMCTTGDMTWLAVKLGRMGVGDFWEDIDLYVRNHLTEMQITDEKKLAKSIITEPVLGKLIPNGPDVLQTRAAEMPTAPPLDPLKETETDIPARVVGSYISEAGCPTHVPKHRFIFTICCPGNVPPGLFAAWESTVVFNDGNAMINLLLNRASPWLDIDSYLPYEGRVVVRNKKAKTLTVRVPLWVNKSAVRVTKKRKKISTQWVGNNLVINKLSKRDFITIKFPMEERRETYTLKWKESDFWVESTNPGHTWEPLENPDKFTFHFKGNTVIDISPRPEGKSYPLYMRDHFKTDKAPSRKVKRFVTGLSLDWF